MKVEDSYGIFNYLSARVRVSTIPSFETCMALEDTLCLGLTTELIGGVSATDTAGVDPTSSNFPIGGCIWTKSYRLILVGRIRCSRSTSIVEVLN